jgi:uncharacterized protein
MNHGKVVVLTGASAGIGRTAASAFAARGDTVVLVARRHGRLDEVVEEVRAAGGEGVAIAADIADPAAVHELLPRIVRDLGRVDVLVNNAGFGQQELLEAMAWDDVERMVRVNVLGLIQLSRATVPIMREQGSGCIVNIASVGGLVAHPLNAVYCATKHAVVGFSKSLRLELAGSGVRVTVVCPGGTRTEFFEVAEASIPFPESFTSGAVLVPTESVANAIVRASDGRRAVVIPRGARLLTWLDRWFPRLSAWGNVRYRDKVLPAPPAD